MLTAAGRGVARATLHSIATSGADRIFALGGVLALAAVAFGLLDDADRPVSAVDMIVGPGNAFVAEAKRQLFGLVGIDPLAGPSEVAVIADESADPELVAADLLGQAEHGPTSPAVLIATSESLGRAVIVEVARQLDELDRRGDGSADTPGRAWTDQGVVTVAADGEHAAALSDEVATEHLEVHTSDDAWYLQRLRNYGSIFLGSRATVAFSDKAIGTNHTLPTGLAAPSATPAGCRWRSSRARGDGRQAPRARSASRVGARAPRRASVHDPSRGEG